MQFKQIDWEMETAAAFDRAFVALQQVETLLAARAELDRRLSHQARLNLGYLRGRVRRTRRTGLALFLVVLGD